MAKKNNKVGVQMRQTYPLKRTVPKAKKTIPSPFRRRKNPTEALGA